MLLNPGESTFIRSHKNKEPQITAYSTAFDNIPKNEGYAVLNIRYGSEYNPYDGLVTFAKLIMNRYS